MTIRRFYVYRDRTEGPLEVVSEMMGEIGVRAEYMEEASDRYYFQYVGTPHDRLAIDLFIKRRFLFH